MEEEEEEEENGSPIDQKRENIIDDLYDAAENDEEGKKGEEIPVHDEL